MTNQNKLHLHNSDHQKDHREPGSQDERRHEGDEAHHPDRDRSHQDKNQHREDKDRKAE